MSAQNDSRAQSQAQYEKMTGTPIPRLVLTLAAPTVVSMLVSSIYNMADTFFVSQLGTSASGAVGVVFSLMAIIQAVGFTLGMGSGSIISRLLGRQQTQDATRYASTAFFTCFGIGCLLTVGGLLFLPPMMRLLGATQTILLYARDYGRYILLAAPFMASSFTMNNILRFEGKASLAMIGLTTGGILNMVLDPLLIFGLGPCPKLGIRGAALATGAGQVLTLLVYLVVYRVKPIPVKLRRACLKRDAALDKKLYSIGVPAILNLALPSLLVFCLNSILAAFADSYVVVLGIYYKLQTFLYLPASGIVQGMRPILSFNYGAGEKARVQRIFRLALALCGAIMAAGTVLCLAAAGPLMGLFTQNPETVAAGGTALRLICLGFVVSAVSVVVSGALEALGRGLPSLVISLCRYVVVMIPLAFVLSRVLGANGVWHAFWLTEAVTAAISWGIYRRIFRGEGGGARR